MARTRGSRASKRGADDFLTKPINQQELLARVRALLRSKKLHDTVARQAAELRDWNQTLERRVEEQISELERFDRLRRFVSSHVAEMILAEHGNLLETHRREISVLNAELLGFAGFAESAEPEDVMEVLRQFQVEMGRVVAEHEATLERTGASVLTAFFNDPIEVEDHAQRAVDMARAMRRRLRSLQRSWQQVGRDLGFRMGIDVGYATLGLVGYEKRWDYSAIGTVTNRAAALCSRAEPEQILISQKLLSRLEDAIEADLVGELELEGFRQPVRCYSVRGRHGEGVDVEKVLDGSKPLTGQRLGHYEILERIGRGGMGSVYRAEDTSLGRLVAVKVLSLGSDPESTGERARTATEEQLARFEREARTVAGLNHPNIVTIYSVEEHEGIRVITMELVSGSTLDELIPKHGLEIDRFLALSEVIADALGAAHDRGIAHRDIKPANVMINDEGRVKVLDFGLAKLREDSTLRPEPLTREGALLGTPAYMAPEQLSSLPIDQRTDVFSLGLLMFEMATGQRPFPAETSVEWIAAVLHDSPTPALEFRPDLPKAVGNVLRRCLRKNPADRFQSANELRDELIAVRQGPEIGTP